ncbi:hypothetical protein G6F59_014357 [Rhizopus arrhizus]|nr:hypothetical protein G6F59_014357 [Rhizopus arrhizus]
MRSVTCSCTCCAVAPGHRVLMTITRNVKGGSSDCASLEYDSTPNSVTSVMMKITSGWCRNAQADRLNLPSSWLMQRRHGAHFFAGGYRVHAMPDQAFAGLYAACQRDGAGVVTQHLHAAQLQRVFLRLDDPDGGLLAVMEQRGGRHRVGGLAVRTPVVEADVGGHAQPDIRRGRFQRELDAVGAALRIGGRCNFAQDGSKGLARQRAQRDGGALAYGKPRQHAFGHVADRVDVAGPRQLVDGCPGRHVLAGVGL